MKYYTHKETGEPLALLDNAMVDVCRGNTSTKYPHISDKICVANLCIFPERWSGHGITFMAISFPELKNFKRISKEKFFKLCPDFGQFRHHNDHSMDSYILEKIPVRKKSFGKQ